MTIYSRRELFLYLARVEPALDELTHFEVLDVSPTSSLVTIQRAFHNLATRAHPDRHRSQLSTDEYERLTRVYARIAEAYRVLRDDELRAKYVRSLRDAKRKGGGGRSASAASRAPRSDAEGAVALLDRKAQRLYRRAQAALRTGDKRSAELNLKLALAKQPDSAVLRAALKDLQRSK